MAVVDTAGLSPAARRHMVVGASIGRLLAVASVSLLAMVLLAVLVLGLTHQSAAPTGAFGINQMGLPSAFRARPAPTFALTGFDGNPVQLTDLRGQVVVLNFWASWCAPCRDEAPVLERAWQTTRNRGVTFVGLATWDEDQNSRSFLRQFPASYVSALDPSGETAIAYGIRGLPETIFVGREGEIARKWVGPLSERDLNAVLAPLLQ